MNRLDLQHEGTLPKKTRYTIYKRYLSGGAPAFAHCMNACTLAAAIGYAQRMAPRGYITNHVEKP